MALQASTAPIPFAVEIARAREQFLDDLLGIVQDAYHKTACQRRKFEMFSLGCDFSLLVMAANLDRYNEEIRAGLRTPPDPKGSPTP